VRLSVQSSIPSKQNKGHNSPKTPPKNERERERENKKSQITK
jgi:hypothetical protein